MGTFCSSGNRRTAETGGDRFHTGRHTLLGVCDSPDNTHMGVFRTLGMDIDIPAGFSYT